MRIGLNTTEPVASDAPVGNSSIFAPECATLRIHLHAEARALAAAAAAAALAVVVAVVVAVVLLLCV